MSVADAWAAQTTTVTAAKRAERERLDKQTAEYLASGKQIDYRDPYGRKIGDDNQSQATTRKPNWRDMAITPQAAEKRAHMRWNNKDSL